MKARYLWTILADAPMVVCAAGSSGTRNVPTITLDTWNAFAAIAGSAAWSNPDGCDASDIVVLLFSNTYYKEVLATAMTASVSEKTISFWTSGCVSTPWGTRPVVTVATLN